MIKLWIFPDVVSLDAYEEGFCVITLDQPISLNALNVKTKAFVFTGRRGQMAGPASAPGLISKI
jgi:hypothetical protein